MSDRDDIRQRTLEAAHLQMIEGNPLDADDLAMFEMFDREGFSPDQAIAYVASRIRVQADMKNKQ
ncbi:hypothetical protein IFT66_11780 [Rhizobium sp. CFBP 13726]|uniref:hypothetical protein n=1 Tax=Rhizobium sp. CFBP 13726 TaxID=2775296 RepID=UPI00177B5323|nr:hypothetical protein [Rhizobium sp. CFBP 13726]MBD8651758.1 hypothetical protein [Rhizobium sp. CFBP 13726]